MKWVSRLAAVGVVWGVLSSVSYAQQGAGAPQPAGRSADGVLIAIIDVPLVMEKYTRVKQQMDSIKEDMKAFETDVVEQRKSLSQRGAQLEQLRRESPDYKQLEESLTKDSTNLQVRIQLKQKEIVDKQARCYYDAYNEVLVVVRRIADQYNIGLVLRFDSKEMDSGDLNSVARGMSRAVVFHRNLDITQLVVDELNRNAQAQRPAPPGGPEARVR